MKSRISHCKPEHLELVQRLHEQVQSHQVNESPIQENSGAENKIKIPKAVLPLKRESVYAAVPRPERSDLLQYVIKKDAKIFRDITKRVTNSKKRIIKPAYYYGTNQESQKGNSDQYNESSK